MIKCTFIVFFVVSSFSAVLSQSGNSSSKDTVQNSLKKGSLSLQFGIAANLSLEAFSNYSISVKYHISRKSAFRLGAGGNFSNNKGTVESQYGIRKTYSYSYNYNFELNYLFYINPSSTVNVFFGGGPIIKLGNVDSYIPYGRIGFDSRTSNSWSAGPKLVAGGEWFFLKKISLFVQYEALWSYGKNKDSDSYLSENSGYFSSSTTDENTVEFIGNTARLGLSIYF